MILRPGSFLQNRYEIIELIGTGGMSEVYKAKCHKLNRMVAIKLLKNEFSEDADFVRKFNMEAQAAGGFSDPNIVNVYDVVNENDHHYIVMELIEGITLKKYIGEKGHLDTREAVGIAIQVSQGIGAAHRRNIIHRDVKPQNMILSSDGKVKVADFGIARAVTSQTQNSQAMGSVHYISPEQAKGEFTDARSDIYSLGITIYEMVTGRLPFTGDNTVSIALAHIEETITPPSVYNPDIPAFLEKIILKCTEKDPGKRYQNVDDLIADLRTVLSDPDSLPDDPKSVDEGDTREILKNDLKKIRGAASFLKPGDHSGSGRRTGGIPAYVPVIGAVIAGILLLLILLRLLGVIGNGKPEETEPPVTMFAPSESSISDTETYVPYLIGLSETRAAEELSKNNLSMIVSQRAYSDRFNAGDIMEQNPEAAEIIPKYTRVSVIVSLGREQKDLSRFGLLSMDGEAAQKFLREEGFVVSVTEEFSDSIPKGEVISYSPEKADVSSRITLTVSAGPEIKKVSVPKLAGSTEDVALSLLESAGLKPGNRDTQYSEYPAGMVIFQGAAEGIELEEGSKVSYVVSAGPNPETAAALQTGAVDAVPEEGVAIVEPLTGESHYVASIENTYDLSNQIGPGASGSSFTVMIRLMQIVNGEKVYSTLMEPRMITGDTILPVRFRAIEGAYGVDEGYVEIVDAENGKVLQSYEVQFFNVQ